MEFWHRGSVSGKIYAMKKVEEIAREIRKILLKHPPGKRLPGARKLARLLGTSPATVEKALLMLEEQGFIVRRERSGSFPLKAKLNLVKSAFFFPFSLDEYDSRVITGYISELGMPPMVILFGEEFPGDTLVNALEHFVDFVFIVPPPADLPSFSQLKNILEKIYQDYSDRIYLLDRCIGEPYKCIRFDDMGASIRVGKLLLKKGYTKFLLCYPVNYLYVPYHRLSGILSVYEKAGVPVDYRKIAGIPSPDEAMDYKLIISAEDYLSLKILASLRKNRVRVPEDVKIFSFGGYRFVHEHLREPIAGIIQPLEKLGRLAAKIAGGGIELENEELVIEFEGFVNEWLL